MPQPRVQSLERALDLLEALAGADELGVSEIAAQTGLVPSTAHRLLGTLVARGYAAQSPATGRYLLGYKLLELTSGVQDRLGRLRTAARPHLEAIQSETGETTNLVVLEGRDVVYIDVGLRARAACACITEVGRSIPAHTSGAGKALLAWRDPADVAALLDGAPLAPSTPRTLTTLDALQEDLAQHPPPRLRDRQRGARARASRASRRRCSTARGRPVAAISVSGPIVAHPATRRRPTSPALLARARRGGRREPGLRTTTGGPQAARLKTRSVARGATRPSRRR